MIITKGHIENENPCNHWGCLNAENRIVLDIGCGRTWNQEPTTPEYFLQSKALRVIAIDIWDHEEQWFNENVKDDRLIAITDRIDTAEKIREYLDIYYPDVIKCDIEGDEKCFEEITAEDLGEVYQIAIEYHDEEMKAMMLDKCETWGFRTAILYSAAGFDPDKLGVICMTKGVKIFADGANLTEMVRLSKLPYVEGLTTNPTLMRKAGVKDYEEFGRSVVAKIKDKPISFEVLSDDLEEMYEQAKVIASWGPNVYVKIPVTNSEGVSCESLIYQLNWHGIKINVTAITTIDQVKVVFSKLAYKRGVYISIFAGRIADTGVNPVPVIRDAVKLTKGTDVEIIWASTREIYNITQAERAGCDIITVPGDLLNKLSLKGKDLTEYSLDTVKMFYKDAKKAGYKI